MLLTIVFFLMVIISILILLKTPRLGSLGTAFNGEVVHVTKVEKRIKLLIFVFSALVYLLLFFNTTQMFSY